MLFLSICCDKSHMEMEWITRAIHAKFLYKQYLYQTINIPCVPPACPASKVAVPLSIQRQPDACRRRALPSRKGDRVTLIDKPRTLIKKHGLIPKALFDIRQRQFLRTLIDDMVDDTEFFRFIGRHEVIAIQGFFDRVIIPPGMLGVN